MNIHIEIKNLVKQERLYTYQILKKLNELDYSRQYCELGYSSLFDYCTRELQYSADQACRRIASARILKQTPELNAKVQTGELGLNHLSKANSLFNKIPMNHADKSNLFDRLTNTSSKEAEKIIASINPEKLKVEKIKPVANNKNEIKFYADDELLKKLQKIKDLLRKDNIEDLVNTLCEDFLAKKKKTEIALIDQGSLENKKNSRYIPSQIKKMVSQRAKETCEFIGKNGVRCTSTHKLEYAHIKPFAHGGKATLSNLKLFCHGHNVFDAITIFGDKTMQRYLERSY